MGKVRKEYTLPEWAFLDGAGPDGDTLEGRDVLIHVRSGSIIEIFADASGKMNFYNETLTLKFEAENALGLTEHYTAALHYCTTLDEVKDRGMIIEKVMKPAAAWYGRYIKWEDVNIIEESIGSLN